MKTLFLIANNLVAGDLNYLKTENIDDKREKRVLSIEGEKAALVNILNDLNERKIGKFPEGLKLSYFKDSQEHDFNYHLPNGESIEDIKQRITKVINKIVMEDNEVTAIFTHQIAINSYLMNYCEVSYNLDDHLVLNYKDQVVSNFNSLIIYKIVYNDDNELIDIKTY